MRGMLWLQILQEHVQVFELNNKVIGSLPVGTRQSFRAVLRLLPPELLLCICGVVFAGAMMLMIPYFSSLAAWLEGTDTAELEVEGHPSAPINKEL